MGHGGVVVVSHDREVPESRRDAPRCAEIRRDSPRGPRGAERSRELPRFAEGRRLGRAGAQRTSSDPRDLPTSPHISPHLPTSRCSTASRRTSCTPRAATGSCTQAHISPHLPASPHISPYLGHGEPYAGSYSTDFSCIRPHSVVCAAHARGALMTSACLHLQARTRTFCAAPRCSARPWSRWRATPRRLARRREERSPKSLDRDSRPHLTHHPSSHLYTPLTLVILIHATHTARRLSLPPLL